MALIKDLLKRVRKEEDEHVELPVEDSPSEKITVRIDHLGGLVDVDRLMKFLREGNILFLKTKDLQKRDLGQFQTAVQKLKRVCTNMGFDLAGTEEGYIVVTPRFAQIARD